LKKTVLAIDLGGTKLAHAIVDEDGQILDEGRQSVVPQNGPDFLIKQITEMTLDSISRYPQIIAVGIAAAGPLDPTEGILLDPTNFLTDGKGWGPLALAQRLSTSIGKKVLVENDAAAAVLGEAWRGKLTYTKNGVVITLGTGVGVGVLANGKLLRSGRQLHPEVGHIRLNAWDLSAPCGCGNFGCIEAYISGKNFTARLAKQWGEKDLNGEDLVRRARNGERKALEAFTLYSEQFALAVESIVVLFSPEIIVIAGGFSASSDLFLTKSHQYLEHLLQRRRCGIDLYPKIEVSMLADKSGILGAAHLALQSSLRFP
jgi:glucokinase